MHQMTRLLLAALLVATPLHAAAEVDSIVLGMGCFWGAEKRMAALPGVVDVESGYAGGDAETAGYRDVLNLEQAIKRGRSDQRNHAEVVRVTFDPVRVSLEDVLIRFWENHDPTQGDRQGNDIGTNYRSAIYTNSAAQRTLAVATRDAYQQALDAAGYGPITTEIAPLRNYNRAERYHQDYLDKNPNGYCGLGGTKVAYPGQPEQAPPEVLNAAHLDQERQLIVFEAEDCPFCRQFRAEVLDGWSSQVPVATTVADDPPAGWTLATPVLATPTMVLFEDGRELSRYTGYTGDRAAFWQWLRELHPQAENAALMMP
jgi:peptide methionine sulfoxide reductase msrA/msrB